MVPSLLFRRWGRMLTRAGGLRQSGGGFLQCPLHCEETVEPWHTNRRKSDKFTFGLWTSATPAATRSAGRPASRSRRSRSSASSAKVGAYGVNFHDNDLIPIDATPPSATGSSTDFKSALKDNGLVVPDGDDQPLLDPVFKDGAFTSNNAQVRAYAIQKTMRAMDLGAEMGAKIYVFWGGREGVESDATKNPVDAIKRFREAINFLCEYSIDQGYGYKFAFEAKPNEPRGHIYFAVTGSVPRASSRRSITPRCAA